MFVRVMLAACAAVLFGGSAAVPHGPGRLLSSAEADAAVGGDGNGLCCQKRPACQLEPGAPTADCAGGNPDPDGDPATPSPPGSCDGSQARHYKHPTNPDEECVVADQPDASCELEPPGATTVCLVKQRCEWNDLNGFCEPKADVFENPSEIYGGKCKPSQSECPVIADGPLD